MKTITINKTNPTIIFCLPGRSFSGNFLKSWSGTLLGCLQNGINPLLSQEYDPNVYYVRNKCLGGDVLRGAGQKPFDGKVPYDYMMWIDSDIVFGFDQLLKLLRWDVPIVAGVYVMSDNTHYAAVKDWDIEFFNSHGTFQFLTPADLQGQENLVDVAYTGFGFVLVKSGVFESLEYPWFRPLFHTMGENISDFSSEDVSLCINLKEKGYRIQIDPTVRVGHEKSLVL